MNYNQEGMNLMEDIMSLSGTSWEIPVNKMDKIFTSEAGGAIYVGGWEAAENLTLLQTANIKGVVNCTTDLYNKHRKHCEYFKFNISAWKNITEDKPENVGKFVVPMLEFVRKHLKRGESVLLHCLVGAHRAGSTGIICLIYFAGLDYRDAKREAIERRPIIYPIGDFPELLERCNKLASISGNQWLL